MKKIVGYFFVLLAVAGTNKAKAQVIDTAQYIFTYTLRFNTDSTDNKKFVTETLTLLEGKYCSHFIGSAILKRDSILHQAVTSGASVNQIVNDPALRGLRSSFPEIFKYFSTGKMEECRILFRRFKWEDTLPAINWHITGDTIHWKGYTCMQATGRLKGRDYTVLFCIDLPIPDGPWKLHGLPGLIVKASDARQEVFFELTSAGKVDTNNPTLIKDKEFIKTTRKDFFKLVKASQDDPLGVVQSITGQEVKVTGNVPPRKQTPPKNAFELEDQ